MFELAMLPWFLGYLWFCDSSRARVEPQARKEPVLPRIGPDYDIPHRYLSSEEILNTKYGWHCS